MKRDNYFRMMKEGPFRAFRNLPVGWLLQIIHSTDTTERWFRICSELFFVFISFLFILNYQNSVYVSFLLAFIIVHTLSWFFTGNFWVYMLDSFNWVKNRGLNSTIEYLEITKKFFIYTNSCDAVLIYGSMCRFKFHIRSDIDLRIIRRRDSWKGLLALPVGYVLRIYSFFTLHPVDFQVVDSLDFVNRQMRDDEHPIILFLRPGFSIKNPGLRFESLKENPSMVLKNNV